MAEAKGTAMPQAYGEATSSRAIYAAFGDGLTSNSVAMMTKVVFALWAVHLQMSPSAIGIASSASAFLPFLLSIHGGVLMDRLGARGVTLAYVITTALAMPGAWPGCRRRPGAGRPRPVRRSISSIRRMAP